ncbi:cytochrome c oxidase subunit II [Pseudoroseicyclus sp. CLL3-39]|uniref:Cytochrome c oxidase subunit 2 n=2 Tax=Pseudoroseicyclus tamaricis TaxID=2705421 RepID=A0A6B2JK05_9RHOB|nr:cytochrome c oxidase subunit II [Pseudoroseicyclus tamaricis]
MTALAAAATSLFGAAAARAQTPEIQELLGDLPVIGHPQSGAVGWQPAATELARDIHWLDGMLLWIISGIVLLVMALILIVIVRYNRRANPTPKRFTHNSPLEIAWTIVPIVILVFIGSFSLPVLFKQQVIPEGDINIKVTGYQWYWGYEYVDEGVYFDAFMIGSGAGQINEEVVDQLESYGYSADDYLLAADNAVVVPVGATVVMTVTGADVIHSWTIPAFGVKQDAVPGRLAQLWFAPEIEGVYFGQCSELCGKDHAYMPIVVKVVDQETYDAWLELAREEYPA